MKFVTYLNDSQKEQAALLIEGQLYNLNDIDARLPSTMMAMLEDWEV